MTLRDRPSPGVARGHRISDVGNFVGTSGTVNPKLKYTNYEASVILGDRSDELKTTELRT